jgi:hypothetical protein
MKFVIIICLITLIRAQICPVARATADIKKYGIYSHKVSEFLAEKVKKCRADENMEILAAGAVGLGILAIFAPFLAPAFAAKGLFGAAAVSNGLATIGGGALAAGGAGMLGGTIVLATAGGFGGSVIGYLNLENKCFRKAVRKIPKKYKDFILWENGNVMYSGDFENGLFNGTGVFKAADGKIIHTGRFLNGLAVM